ncbi:hypothetical protein [Azospirillum largimobile]
MLGATFIKAGAGALRIASPGRPVVVGIIMTAVPVRNEMVGASGLLHCLR